MRLCYNKRKRLEMKVVSNNFELVVSFLARFIGKRGAKIVICLVLISLGLKNADIKRQFGVSWDSLRKYREAYDSRNIEPLFELQAERAKSELEQYESVILADFEANPPKTLRECQARIKSLTGITRSLHRIRVFLLKRGLKAGRTGSNPPKQTL